MNQSHLILSVEKNIFDRMALLSLANGSKRSFHSALKLFVLILLTSILNGCGFHLRGNIQIPPSILPIAVITKSGHSPFERLLQNQLRLQDLDVTDDPAKAKYWIVILDEQMRQDIAAVAASTAPRQYQLTYQVVFTLQKANQQSTPYIPTTISVNRLLTINSNRILGSDSEAALLKEEMRVDAARQVLARLENYLYIKNNQ